MMNNRFYPEWQSFAYKYRGQENDKLEDLARILFRKELGIKQGLFQRVNHKGNETDVIEIDGKVIGFQAKYFDHGIDADNIIHSMREAKDGNPNQTHYYIYCNQSFGNPRRRKGSKKTDRIPETTTEEEKITNIAIELGLTIVWKLNKAILDEAASERWICDVFFDVNGKLENLINDEKRHSEIAFNSIKYSYPFNGKELHINRDGVISRINNQAPSTICVIHGDGGCGKTAILHEFFDQYGKDVPVCYRKATTLNVKSLSEVFHQSEDYTFLDFKEAFSDCERKYFIIDSAEHLDELDDGTIAPSLIKGLLEDHWCVVFTVRNVFVSDLLNLLTCELDTVEITKEEIGLLSTNELNTISRNYNLNLPKDQTLVDRIRNLFYLNLFIEYYGEIDLTASDSVFIKLIWEKKIKGKNNRLGYLREKEFESFVADRMKSGLFFLSPEDYTSQEFYALVEDEIVGIDPNNGLYITHDIFEEWGLYRIVEKQWNNAGNIMSFLNGLGDSHSVRRIFRLWLKDKVSECPETIQRITETAFAGAMPGLWKEEVLCAILQTNKSELFLSQYEEQILTNYDGFANKIIWALRVGCLYVRSVFAHKDFFVPQYAAIGSGWNYIVDLLYRNQGGVELPIWLPVLHDWTQGNHRGETTRKAGLIVIEYYKSEYNKRDKYKDGIKKLVHDILNHSVWETKVELAALLHQCIEDDELSDDLPEFILGESVGAMNIQLAIPQQVIELCFCYWKEHEDNEDENDPYGYHSKYDRNGFGIDENGVAFKYFPPGADQTPTSALLLADTTLAVTFIIRLMNECVETYAQSKFEGVLIKVNITDGADRNNWQWHSETLWGMYRGLGTTTAPYCLMSLHMALERHLLNLSRKGNFDECRAIMQRLLFECHSSSVSAVVCSLVLAYPNEYWQEALFLFRVITFFQMDGQRAIMEHQAGEMYKLSAGLNPIVDKERMETTKQEFRQRNLENICLNYQCFGSNVLTVKENEALIQKIYGILDKHRELLYKVQGEGGRYLEILLSRMDRRRLKIINREVNENNIAFHLEPELNEETRKMSEEAVVEQQEMMKYIGLFNWAYAKMYGKTPLNPEYDNNVSKVYKDARELDEELKNGRNQFPMDGNTLPWVSACLLKFYRKELSAEQLDWCKCVVENKLKGGINAMDGTYACIHVLPLLIELFPKDKEKYAEWLFLYLQNPGYGNKQTCDYVFDAVRAYGLWGSEPTLMKNILKKYVQGLSQENIHPHHLKIIFGLIPDKPDQETTDIAVSSLEHIPRLLEKDRNAETGMFDVLGVLANMLMSINSTDILECLPYTHPIAKESNLGDAFLRQLIMVADRCKNPDRFWLIWNSFRSLVSDWVNNRGEGQLMVYTLNIQWIDGIKEWHSLRKQDLEFFSYLANHCEGSAVIAEGLVKLLTTIGSNYRNEGIRWLSTAFGHYPSMSLDNTVTMQYLEFVMMPYVYTNKMQIRKNPELLADVRTILNFMVSKSSVTGFILRDIVN